MTTGIGFGMRKTVSGNTNLQVEVDAFSIMVECYTRVLSEQLRAFRVSPAVNQAVQAVHPNSAVSVPVPGEEVSAVDRFTEKPCPKARAILCSFKEQILA
jgi:hypothetical protein